MKYLLFLLLAFSSTPAFSQDVRTTTDTASFYLGKPGIFLRADLTRAAIIGAFTFYWSKWDYTSLRFKADGRFEQFSWVSCAAHRFDDSGSWRLVDSRTVEILSKRQQLRFNVVQSEGINFLVPYNRALEFIRTVGMSRDIKRGDKEGLDRETIFSFTWEGGLWKKNFYRRFRAGG